MDQRSEFRLYRGEQYDPDLNLYYLRARYYNPATGRFMSRDQEDGKAKDPASLHKYLYAGGDPINGLDPSGRAEVEQYALTIGKRTITVSARALEFGGALSCAFGIDVYIVALLEEPTKIDITLGGIGVLSGCGLAALPYYLIAVE